MVNKETGAREDGKVVSLDKTGLIIFAVTGVIALVFVIIGIVLLAGGGAKELALNRAVYLEDANYGDTFQYTFTCEESGYYCLHTNSAEVRGVYSNGRTVSLYGGAEPDYGYENAYSVYMSRGETYQIEIQATGYSHAKVVLTFEE